MRIYEQDGVFIAEMDYLDEHIIKIGRTWEEAREKLLTKIMVLDMIG